MYLPSVKLHLSLSCKECILKLYQATKCTLCRGGRKKIKLNLPDNCLKSHLPACDWNYKSHCFELNQIHPGRKTGWCGSSSVGRSRWGKTQVCPQGDSPSEVRLWPGTWTACLTLPPAKVSTNTFLTKLSSGAVWAPSSLTWDYLSLCFTGKVRIPTWRLTTLK